MSLRPEIRAAALEFAETLRKLDGSHRPKEHRTHVEEAEGRRCFAQIRRGAADQDAAEIYVLSAIEVPEAVGRELPTFVLVAVLYALHKQRYAGQALPRFGRNAQHTSFGRSLRRLRRGLRAGEESLDLRFQAVLNSRREDLMYHLRSLVGRIANSQDDDIPVDYERLVLDLLRWDAPGRSIQRQWARDYWQHEPVAVTRDIPA